MEEPVRTDEKGNIVGAAMEDSHWEGATLVVKVREGIRFQDGTTLTAHSIRRAFDEVQKWKAPHPPGTYLNFHPDTTVDVPDDYTIRFNFPEPDGLALAKFRGFHIPSESFLDRRGRIRLQEAGHRRRTLVSHRRSGPVGLGTVHPRRRLLHHREHYSDSLRRPFHLYLALHRLPA